MAFPVSEQNRYISLEERCIIEGRPGGGGLYYNNNFTWNGSDGQTVGVAVPGVYGRAAILSEVTLCSNTGVFVTASWGIYSMGNSNSAGLQAATPSNGGTIIIPWKISNALQGGVSNLTLNFRNQTGGTPAPIWLSFGWQGYYITDDLNFNAKHTILTLGTSISEGGSYAAGTDNLYDFKFRNWLRDSQGYDVRLVNQARGGGNSNQLQTYINRNIPFLVNPASVIIYEHGINDIAGSISTSTTLDNISNFLKWKKALHPNAIVLVLSPIRTSNTTNESGLVTLRAAMQSFINDYNDSSVVFVEGTATAWNIGENGTYLSDGVHPNPAGYQKIFEAIRDKWINLNLQLR